MATYQIAFNLSTKVVLIQADGAALPSGFKDIGSFTHDEDEVTPPGLEHDINHVVWHHVREALYHTSSVTGDLIASPMQFPDNITDMAGVKLRWQIASVNGYADFTIGVGETHKLNPTVMPAQAQEQAVFTYASGTPAVATVDANGVVTGVSAGTSVITITAADGGGPNRTDTVTVTVA